MKDSSPSPKEKRPSPAMRSPAPPPTFSGSTRDGPSTSIPDPKAKASSEGPRRPTAAGFGQPPSEAEEDLYRRYEREQTIIQEELVRLAKRERETARGSLNSSVLREKNYANQERQRAEQLAKDLERKEAELKRLDSFHKEQLASIEKKNTEIYKLTAEQFHTAATNAELRIKNRSYDPVCMDFQSNILKCYKENRQELLNCSDLAKDYRRCVSAAQKLLFTEKVTACLLIMMPVTSIYKEHLCYTLGASLPAHPSARSVAIIFLLLYGAVNICTQNVVGTVNLCPTELTL
ncbi:hypothetical protein FKM82_004422 [Ascaphus truei]